MIIGFAAAKINVIGWIVSILLFNYDGVIGHSAAGTATAASLCQLLTAARTESSRRSCSSSAYISQQILYSPTRDSSDIKKPNTMNDELKNLEAIEELFLPFLNCCHSSTASYTRRHRAASVP